MKKLQINLSILFLSVVLFVACTSGTQEQDQRTAASPEYQQEQVVGLVEDVLTKAEQDALTAYLPVLLSKKSIRPYRIPNSPQQASIFPVIRQLPEHDTAQPFFNGVFRFQFDRCFVIESSKFL